MSDTQKNNDGHNSPLQSAVALAYQAGSSAPTVVAKGKGLVAQAIIDRAREHGVYVHQSKELVALLMQVELDKDIPPALYRVVAELLAWLYHIEKQQNAGEIIPFTPSISPVSDNSKITP
ncbi:EscU/YscU/HrcU family type III secretion system export apparatus switch protein [Sapientia aquatica]|uniref:Flagellar biosynthesis protein n=1 Tax=Sapientia aquatica TaxID=1549640 RepID=A0A4R5W5E7_9BURK|nr:EscU/YscU/HrcU family type III secretion system export apparatus switch protein [Sapientia aquatica]TDK68341.1 flagellar biosynthesis protein [Sapientia aquatica]